jgi:hypothetical protein
MSLPLRKTRFCGVLITDYEIEKFGVVGLQG